MLNIIKDILSECGYEYLKKVEYQYADQEYEVSILKNTNIVSQVFLILPIKESELLKINIKDDFISDISVLFKDSGVYAPDMDKNTSLVFCVERDLLSERLNQHMVGIEDDPFYFKKYVFYYSLSEESDFKNLKKQYNKSTVQLIQSYIFNKLNFDNFKANIANENMYRLISDMLIKIPVLPISFDIEEAQIKDIDFYMKETKTFQNKNTDKLDMMTELLLSNDECEAQEQADMLIKIWNQEE